MHMKRGSKKWLDNNFLLYGTITVLSAGIFCMIYGLHVLDPTDTEWLLGGGDLSQHYIGWKAYRNSRWMFPIGMTDQLTYPDHSSVIFTDSIPVFAVFFKILSPLLPDEFQFFGFWGILCFILQACLSARIIRHFTGNKLLLITVSVLFTVTPVMIQRMYVHTSLAGQWILMLALEPMFAYRKYSDHKRICKMACVIGVLAASIHIYFVFMCGIILVSFCIEDFLMQKRVKASVWVLCLYLMSVCFMVGILGGFSSDVVASEGGLGHYSCNLNALFNPQGWSCIYKDLAMYTSGQHEGFAYLGAGCIFLFVLAAVLGFHTLHSKAWILNHWKEIVAFVVLILFSTVAALSPVISFGDRLIYEVRLPEFLVKLWSVFRSTGRIAWIIVYVIMFGSIIALTKVMNKKLILAVIAIGTILQIYDIHDVLKAKAQNFHTDAVYETSLETNGIWNMVAEKKEIKHIVFADAMSNDELFAFGNWAFTNHKTINTFYMARSKQENIQRNLKEALADLSPDHLFIFHTFNQLGCLAYDLNYYQADGFIIGTCETFDGFVPMEKSDFRNVWTFGENRCLENGEDTQDGRIVNPGGRSFGPFWNISAGNYIVTIEGDRRLDKDEVAVFSENGKVSHNYEIVETSNDTFTLSLSLTGEGVDNLEVSVWNGAQEPMKLKSITVDIVK